MNSLYTTRIALYRTRQPLVLASASPRRSELLKRIGLDFRVIPSGIEEANRAPEEINEQVERWAREKALAVSRLYQGSWVLGADTVVVLEGRVLGKPRNANEARSMLENLSAKTHEVTSAICLVHQSNRFQRAQAVTSRVLFRSLSAREIEAYIRTGEPLDKAGAYGIQGMGACMVQAVSGSYTNVVGLPLCEILEWLLELEIVAPVV